MSYNLKNELREFLCELAKDENMKVTAAECAKGGLMFAIGCAVGGTMGPHGAVAGGVLMGGLASLTCDDFLPLNKVLKQMPEDRWKILEARVQRILLTQEVQDVLEMISVAVAGSQLRKELIKTLEDFAHDRN